MLFYIYPFAYLNDCVSFFPYQKHTWLQLAIYIYCDNIYSYVFAYKIIMIERNLDLKQIINFQLIYTHVEKYTYETCLLMYTYVHAT